MDWVTRNLDQDWYEGTLPQDKPFCRILLNDSDYGIYDRHTKEFLSLVGVLSIDIVFYNSEFNGKYMSCKTKEDLKEIIK